jgi:PAS domain S-box-containing protein
MIARMFDRISKKRGLAETQNRLEGIVHSAIDGIITIDESQRIVVFNPAAETMFGVSAEDALGQPISRFIPQRFRGAHDRHIQSFRATGVTNRRMGSLGAISGLRADGEEFPIEASISQADVKGERLFTVILRDITERRAAENALKESRRRMQGIVESAMDAIITIDKRQRIILFNPAAERMFGMPAEEALGRFVECLIPERYREQHAAHIEAFCETGETNRSMGALGAISGMRANGEEFPIEASISQVEIGGDRLATVILRDITERVANEESRTLLAREVDHRAKNALAVAQSLVSLTEAPTKEEFVKAVRGRISSLARAHSLLAQSRWQGAPLARIIGDELGAYAQPSQIWLSGPNVSLTPDSVQPLSLVIHELATNACKYGSLSTETGQVEIEWSTIGDGQLHIGWRESGGPVAGEPARHGFGTTLLEQVVTRQLKGAITLAWRPAGLEVAITIPPSAFTVEPAKEGEPARVVAREPVLPDQERGAILIVEDELLIGMELADELKGAGWTVVGPAGTVEQAMKLARETPNLRAALLDINLHGRAAYPVADLLNERSVPFIFCTGYELLDQTERYVRHTVLRKPVNAMRLHSELDRLLAA